MRVLRTVRARSLLLLLALCGALSSYFAVACGTAAPQVELAPAPELTRAPFLHSDQCARCHSKSPTANALTTALGEDASPHGLWQATPMANSFLDPYWRAQMAHAIELAPQSKAEIEGLCVRCHAPMASHAAQLAGRTLDSMETLEHDPLARDGVSCALCHQVQPDGLGTHASFDGRLTIRDEQRIFGPYRDPTPGPMRMNTGYTPTHGEHISSSALCGSCHTLYTQPTPDAQPFLEQAPYLEWRNSEFSDENGATSSSRTCQQCHMPDLGTMKIARMPTGDDFNIAIRDNVRGHVFVGGNAWLLDLLRLNAKELGVKASAENLLRTAAATRAQLAHSSARLEIENLQRTERGVDFELSLSNLTGHKLPSGYPARRAWLHVEVREDRRVLFSSGAFDQRGRLIGIADELAIPHVDRIERADQVAVYEMVAADLSGATTTAQLQMATIAKDTRLLPRGWRTDGPHATETAPVGVASDPNFQAGGDRVSYSVALDSAVTGRVVVVAWLRYQPMPPAWVDSLRDSSTPEARSFLRMFDAAKFSPETLALAIDSID
jgi:hypothetical protein